MLDLRNFLGPNVLSIDTNSYTEWQTVQIQISWFPKMLTDLDLHCLQRQGLSGFNRTRVKLSGASLMMFRLYQLYLFLSGGGGIPLNLGTSEYGSAPAPRGSPTPRVTFADEPPQMYVFVHILLLNFHPCFLKNVHNYLGSLCTCAVWSGPVVTAYIRGVPYLP